MSARLNVPALAADEPVYEGPRLAPSDVGVSLDLLWVVIGAVPMISPDVVGVEGMEMEFSGGPSPDPTIGR